MHQECFQPRTLDSGVDKVLSSAATAFPHQRVTDILQSMESPWRIYKLLLDAAAVPGASVSTDSLVFTKTSIDALFPLTGQLSVLYTALAQVQKAYISTLQVRTALD